MMEEAIRTSPKEYEPWIKYKSRFPLLGAKLPTCDFISEIGQQTTRESAVCSQRKQHYLRWPAVSSTSATIGTGKSMFTVSSLASCHRSIRCAPGYLVSKNKYPVTPLGTLQCCWHVLLCRIRYIRRQQYVALPLEDDNQERVQCTHLFGADERRQSRPNQTLR